MSLLWKIASTPEVPDSVEHYMSGGIGHLEGDDSRSVVGMVPVSTLKKYREHDGNQNHGDHDERVISGIHDDIKSGKGITTPLMMEYDHDKKWGWIGEGNHRLAAADRAGLTHVPVRVYGRSSENGRKRKGIGAPLNLTTQFGRDAHDTYIPPAIHPHHFDGLKP
jgi:hypothetical protein